MQAILDFLTSYWSQMAGLAAGYVVRSFDPVGTIKELVAAGRAKLREVDDRRRGE